VILGGDFVSNYHADACLKGFVDQILMRFDFVCATQRLLLVAVNFALTGLRNQALCSETRFDDATVSNSDSFQGKNFASVVRMREDGSVCLEFSKDKAAGLSRPPIDPTFPEWTLPVVIIVLCQRVCITSLSDVPTNMKDRLFLRPQNDEEGEWNCDQSGVDLGLRKETLWKEVHIFLAEANVQIPPDFTQYRQFRSIYEGL
jgi:hypothetical protein